MKKFKKILGIIVFIISTPFLAIGLIGLLLFTKADLLGAFGQERIFKFKKK